MPFPVTPIQIYNINFFNLSIYNIGWFIYFDLYLIVRMSKILKINELLHEVYNSKL